MPLARRTKARPCHKHKHEDDGRYFRNFTCETPYCSGQEWRCKKCRWFISECQCQFSSGMGRESWCTVDRRYRRRLAAIIAKRDLALTGPATARSGAPAA